MVAKQISSPLYRLVEEMQRLPGIGPKSAQRLAFFLLKGDRNRSLELTRAIEEALEKINYCRQCNNLTSQDICEICVDGSRDSSSLCVVEEPFNIYSIEKTGLFNGYYHVLLGNLSPLRGIGPDELRIAGLVERVRASMPAEIILATSPTTEGSATAHFLSELLSPFPLRISRIALGLPIGADIDYADQVTIAKALEGRTIISSIQSSTGGKLNERPQEQGVMD